MAVVRYARVSSTDQNPSIQRAALKAPGYEVIRAESAAARPPRGERNCEQLRAAGNLLITPSGWWAN